MHKFAFACSILLLCLTTGCGSSGHEQYKISGKVTIDGKPVPAGQITFEPDPSKGNTGPQVRTQIVNGEYATEPDRGCLPGAVLALIEPWNGISSSENAMGEPLHELVTAAFEMPKEETSKDFEVTDYTSAD